MGARAPSVRRREKCRGDRPFEGGFRPPGRPRSHPATGGHQRDAGLCSRTARPRDRGGSRMSAVIFTGPTLSAVDARMVLDVDYRPPAAEGDVYRAAQGHPHLIGIIDGYFERIPAVWHKEILWAIEAETYAALEAAAKALFYPDRNYAVILERAAACGAGEDELLRFREWLPTGRASLKRADALAMLNAIGDRLASGLEPKRVKYAFENTWMWESAWRLAGDL